MNELKPEWTKVMPMLNLPSFGSQDPIPLHFYQMGNVVFIRFNDLDYAIEVNKPHQIVKVEAE